MKNDVKMTFFNEIRSVSTTKCQNNEAMSKKVRRIVDDGSTADRKDIQNIIILS